MAPNATVTVTFPSLTLHYDVIWTDDGIDQAEDIANDIFFATKPAIEAAWLAGDEPNMDVALKSDPSITSRLHFDDTAGMVYPTRTLGKI